MQVKKKLQGRCPSGQEAFKSACFMQVTPPERHVQVHGVRQSTAIYCNTCKYSHSQFFSLSLLCFQSHTLQLVAPQVSRDFWVSASTASALYSIQSIASHVGCILKQLETTQNTITKIVKLQSEGTPCKRTITSEHWQQFVNVAKKKCSPSLCLSQFCTCQSVTIHFPDKRSAYLFNLLDERIHRG